MPLGSCAQHIYKQRGDILLGFEYKDELKELLPEYIDILEEQGEIENRGNGYWTCPFCGSGDKQNYTAAFHITGTSFHCFSCGEHGDIFDLVAYMEDLPNDWKKHYNRAVKIMRPYLNGSIEPKKHDTVSVPKEIKVEDYTDYLQQCHANVANTDYFKQRGLSTDTINRFQLGYDEHKNLVTIPYNPDCKGYVHRVLWDSDNKYCKFGNEIFNIQALHSDGKYLFITEGQIDAMSFEEIGINAIGLGGVNEVSKLVEILKFNPTSKILVIALDNDKAGKRATGKLIEAIADEEINQHYIVNSVLYGKYKDANEFLVTDREGFIKKMSPFKK